MNILTQLNILTFTASLGGRPKSKFGNSLFIWLKNDHVKYFTDPFLSSTNTVLLYQNSILGLGPGCPLSPCAWGSDPPAHRSYTTDNLGKEYSI